MEAKKKKEKRDWNTIVMVLGSVALIGVIAFMLITSSSAYTELNDKVLVLNEKLGTTRGELNTCRAQLENTGQGALPVVPMDI